MSFRRSTLLSSTVKQRICLLLFILYTVRVEALDRPSGWRQPKLSQATGRWRKANPSRFLAVSADFDGDGHSDVAEMFQNESEGQCALFVWLSGSKQWKAVWQGNKGERGTIGIRLVRPGKYQTLCVSDSSACDAQVPGVLELTDSAIEFFFRAESSSILYWDQQIKDFRNAPKGD